MSVRRDSGTASTTTRVAPRAEIGAFLARLAAEGRPPLAELDVATARREMRRRSLELWGEVEPVAEVADLVLPNGHGVAVRSYRPAADRRVPALVYFHGGGWVVGGIETHDGLCRRLANAAGCAVLSVGYRLAPEHPFPAAVHDADAAASWIHASADELAIDAARMSLAGDSAGGNLAAVAARRLAGRGVPVASQVLVYPVTDGRTDTASYETNADGPYLTRADMHWYLDHYASHTSDLEDPDLAPLRADDVSGLPPAYVATAELDPLRSDGTAYAGRLRAAGISVRLEDWPGTIHGFLLMRTVTPVADELIATIVRFLRETWFRPDGP